MNDNESNTRLLIQYLDGELDDNERNQLTTRIANEPALARELDNLQAAKHAVKSYGLRQQLGSIHLEMIRELTPETTKKAPVYKLFKAAFRVAASIIVVVGFISVYLYSSLSSRKLFDSSYQSYAMPSTRGASEESQLEQYYKQNELEKITTAFPLVKQPSVKDLFYAGNAYLRQSNPRMAIQCFQALQQKNFQLGTRVFEDDSEYFLAMSYLQDNQPKLALPLFKKIHSDQQHLYNDKVSNWFLLKLELLVTK